MSDARGERVSIEDGKLTVPDRPIKTAVKPDIR